MRHRRRTDKRYGSPAWRKLTRDVQRRDHWTCQYCGAPSWCADHVQRPDQGGSFWDPINLRAACKSCNVGRRYHGEAWIPPSLRDAAPRRLVNPFRVGVTDYSRPPKPRIG